MIARVGVAVFVPFLFLAQGILAQDRTLRGTVVDAVTGDPVVGAEVQVVGTNMRAFAREDGAWVLEDARRAPSPSS